MCAFSWIEATDEAYVLLLSIDVLVAKRRGALWVGAGVGDMSDFVRWNAHFDVSASHFATWANVVADQIAKGSVLPAAIHNAFPSDAARGAVFITAMANGRQVLHWSACLAVFTIALVSSSRTAEAVIM